MKTPSEFQAAKARSRKLSMVTCYDAWTARILASTEVDALLVGDSAAMVMHGFPDTTAATIEMMCSHTAAVARGRPEKLIVADMPFLSTRQGLPHAVAAAGDLIRAGAQAVKIEGFSGHEELIPHLVESGIPVMGHLGLTPQSIHVLGGHKVQGRDQEAADRVREDALRFMDAGAFALVLECVPSVLAARISQALDIPVIGIGAGADTDGQILVLQDLLGANPGFKPKFLRTYESLHDRIVAAVDKFADQSATGDFPRETESYA